MGRKFVCGVPTHVLVITSLPIKFGGSTGQHTEFIGHPFRGVGIEKFLLKKGIKNK
jgi:hypothetical protein